MEYKKSACSGLVLWN